MQELKKAELFSLHQSSLWPLPAEHCTHRSEESCGTVFHLYLKRQHRLLLQTRNCKAGPISGHLLREIH